MCPDHKNTPQVAVPLLRDRPKPLFAPGAILSRDEPNPGGKIGSAGAGSPGHLTCALFNAAIGVNVIHVPYRGAAPAMQDLIAGRIDYVCTIVPTVIPQIRERDDQGDCDSQPQSFGDLAEARIRTRAGSY